MFDLNRILNKSAICCLALFACLSIATITTSNAHACGTERWPVKTGTDKDNQKVVLNPVDTTIFQLTDIPAPTNPNIRKDSRYAPTELTTYRVSGKMTLIKPEKDGDYHIVIEDNKGRTMIIESASPLCANGSRFEGDIRNVRSAINDHFRGHIKKKKKPNISVTVTGIGFFDKIHGQTGVAPNGIELHPLLSITFN
jgi:hypothetical protein